MRNLGALHLRFGPPKDAAHVLVFKIGKLPGPSEEPRVLRARSNPYDASRIEMLEVRKSRRHITSPRQALPRFLEIRCHVREEKCQRAFGVLSIPPGTLH